MLLKEFCTDRHIVTKETSTYQLIAAICRLTATEYLTIVLFLNRHSDISPNHDLSKKFSTLIAQAFHVFLALNTCAV